jgi:hypothetical protein
LIEENLLDDLVAYRPGDIWQGIPLFKDIKKIIKLGLSGT